MLAKGKGKGKGKGKAPLAIKGGTAEAEAVKEEPRPVRRKLSWAEPVVRVYEVRMPGLGSLVCQAGDGEEPEEEAEETEATFSPHNLSYCFTPCRCPRNPKEARRALPRVKRLDSEGRVWMMQGCSFVEAPEEIQAPD